MTFKEFVNSAFAGKDVAAIVESNTDIINHIIRKCDGFCECLFGGEFIFDTMMGEDTISPILIVNADAAAKNDLLTYLLSDVVSFLQNAGLITGIISEPVNGEATLLRLISEGNTEPIYIILNPVPVRDIMGYPCVSLTRGGVPLPVMTNTHQLAYNSLFSVVCSGVIAASCAAVAGSVLMAGEANTMEAKQLIVKHLPVIESAVPIEDIKLRALLNIMNSGATSFDYNKISRLCGFLEDMVIDTKSVTDIDTRAYSNLNTLQKSILRQCCFKSKDTTLVVFGSLAYSMLFGNSSDIEPFAEMYFEDENALEREGKYMSLKYSSKYMSLGRTLFSKEYNLFIPTKEALIVKDIISSDMYAEDHYRLYYLCQYLSECKNLDALYLEAEEANVAKQAVNNAIKYALDSVPLETLIDLNLLD